MSNHTPETEDVRSNYMSGAWLKGDRNPDQFNPAVYKPIYFAEFDRWLAEVERAAAEKARSTTMSDNRTNEPTEAQVEAAAKALNALAVENNGTDDWEDWTVEARTALVAAQGAETEELRADVMTVEEAIESVLKRPGVYGLVDKEGHRSMKAERDAALAAVERVRALCNFAKLSEEDPHNDWNTARHVMAGSILAALVLTAGQEGESSES